MRLDEHVSSISSEKESFHSFFSRIKSTRQIIYTLAVRSIKIKYAQTILGITWSLIQPLTAVFIFSFFFNYIIHFDALKWPYPVFAFTGIVVWNFFSYIFSTGSTAIRESGALIQKFNFPRINLIISKFLVGAVELGMSLIIVIAMLIWMEHLPGFQIILLPIVLFLSGLFGLGMAMLVAASTYKLRDAFHIVPFLVNFGIWLTPVFFPVSILPNQLQKVIWFNPMAGFIEYFRWTLLGGELPNFNYLYGIGIGLLVFGIGIVMMKKIEDKIIDHL